jgi:uncharacterized protein YndB with AHSA1/START domain
MKKEALRVTSTIPVAPTTLYFAWIDSTHHSSMTGQTAKIDPVVGAKYSACDGYVTGKLVILDLGRRIVESWRTTDFPRDAADSRVEVHFETLGQSTRLLILHTDIPEGQSEKYKALWNERYIGPMRSYFSKFLPDPRIPTPRRVPPPPPEPDDDDDDVPAKAPKAKPGAKIAPPARSGPSLHKTEAAKPAPQAAAKPAPKAAAKPAPKPAPKAAAKPAPKAAKPAPKAAPKGKAKLSPAKKPAPAKAKAKAKPAKKPAPKKATPKKPASKPAKGKPAKGKKKR